MKKNILSFASFLTLGLLLISCGEDSTSNQTTTTTSSTASTNTPPVDSGPVIYKRTCNTCHQADGKGMQGAYPPLASSDYLLADKFRAIRQVLKGSTNKITVNGTDFNGVMPPQPLNDSEIANVLTYVYHSFGNNGFNALVLLK